MQNILFLVKKHFIYLIFLFLILSVGGLSVYGIYLGTLNKNSNTFEMDEISSDIENQQVESKEKEIINVDIKGAVKKPGVYQVNKNTIINDVVTLAGGFTTDAFTNGINLSKKVTDEMVIYIYTKNEMKKTTIKEVSTKNCNVPSYNICECTDKKESIIETNNEENKTTNNETTNNGNSSGEKKEPTNQIININTAGISELTTLTGIGDAKAKAIIKYREEKGRFSNISDIMNVSGIGEAIFAKIKDFITV